MRGSRLGPWGRGGAWGTGCRMVVAGWHPQPQPSPRPVPRHRCAGDGPGTAQGGDASALLALRLPVPAAPLLSSAFWPRGAQGCWRVLGDSVPAQGGRDPVQPGARPRPPCRCRQPLPAVRLRPADQRPPQPGALPAPRRHHGHCQGGRGGRLWSPVRAGGCGTARGHGWGLVGAGLGVPAAPQRDVGVV